MLFRFESVAFVDGGALDICYYVCSFEIFVAVFSKNVKEMDFYCSRWKSLAELKGMFVQSFHSIIHFSCHILVYFSVSIIL